MPFAVTDGELRALSTLTNPYNPIVRPFGITSYRNAVTTYENIYKSQPNIRTVVDYRARQIGQIEAGLFERVSDTELVRRRDHPLDRLLRRPHPKWSRARFFRSLSGDLDVFDNSVLIKVKPAGSRAAAALTRIPANRIFPVGGDWLTPDGFQIMGTGNIFAWDEVVHVCGYNPEDVRWGLSPIETLRRILSEDVASGEAREQFWDRAARLSGWIGRPAEAPDWGKPAGNAATSGRDRFLESWRDRMTGNGPEAGSTPILEEGMAFHQETFDAQAAQYLEARKLTGVESSRAYHLHPALLGFTDTAPDDTTRRGYIADNLSPDLDRLAGELLLQLLPDFETDLDALDRFAIIFDIDAKLRGDFLAEAEATSRATGGPWMLRNEARARRGLPPVPGGNDLITPLNVTTGGRANPTDTAPGTPGLGQAARHPNTKAATTTNDALENLTPTARTWAEQHASIVANNVDRQAARFRSRMGAGHDAESAFNKTRADTELGDDLSGLALEYAPTAAAGTADRFGIDYDVTTEEAWLINNARIAAESYNAKTLADVLAAESSPDVDTLDEADEAFAAASGARADAFGIGRVVTIAGFAMMGAATQGGASSKTWLVNSENPRESHAVLDGVTIPIQDNFDVGGYEAPWPGSSDLPAEEVAGCTCGVEFN